MENKNTLNFQLLLETVLSLKDSKLKQQLYSLVKIINYLSLNNLLHENSLQNSNYEYIHQFASNLDELIADYKFHHHHINSNLSKNLLTIKFHLSHLS